MQAQTATQETPGTADPVAALDEQAQEKRRNAWWASKAFQDGWRFKVRNLDKDFAANEWEEQGRSLMALRGLIAQFPKPEALAAAGEVLKAPGRPHPLPQDLWSKHYYRRMFFERFLQGPFDDTRRTWMRELGQAWQWHIDERRPEAFGWKHPFLMARRGMLPAEVGEAMMHDGTLDRMDKATLAGPVLDHAIQKNDTLLLDILDAKGIRPEYPGTPLIIHLARRHLSHAITRYADLCDPGAVNGWGLNAGHIAAARLTSWKRDRNAQDGYSRKNPGEMAMACHRLAATLGALERIGVAIHDPAPKAPKPPATGEKRERRSSKVCREGETIWSVLARREEPDPKRGEDLPRGTKAMVESLLLLGALPPGNDESMDPIDDDNDEPVAPPPRRARL